MKKGFSKTGLVLIGSMLVCLLICLAVLIPMGGPGGSGAEDLNDEGSPDLKTVMEGSSPILIFDKRPQTRALLAAYEAGSIESVEAGGKETAVPGEVREIYRALKNIAVTGETGAAEGNPLEVRFLLEDGNEADFAFAGENVFLADGAAYEVTGLDALRAQIDEIK